METIAGPTMTKEQAGKAAGVRAAEFALAPFSETRPAGQQIEDVRQELETMRSAVAEAVGRQRSTALLNDIRAGLWEAFRLMLLAPRVRRKS